MSTESKPVVPITAQTRAEFVEKVKAVLKAEYKAGETVNPQKFSAEHQVRSKNLRVAVEALQAEGFDLQWPAAVAPMVKRS